MKVTLRILLSCDYWWYITGAWEYIESTRDVVRDLEKRVGLAKSNVEQITTIMAKWSESPMYLRKGDKKDSLLNLEVFNG